MHDIKRNSKTGELVAIFDPESVMMIISGKLDGDGRLRAQSYTPPTNPPMVLTTAAHFIATLTKAASCQYGLPLDDLLEEVSKLVMSGGIIRTGKPHDNK